MTWKTFWGARFKVSKKLKAGEKYCITGPMTSFWWKPKLRPPLHRWRARCRAIGMKSSFIRRMRKLGDNDRADVLNFARHLKRAKERIAADPRPYEERQPLLSLLYPRKT